jgi:phospholipid transport system transporter-binding protein
MMIQENDRFVIRGSLNMQTVPAVFKQGVQQLARGDLRVDFAAVESVDSAMVSMLLGWLRAAQAHKHQLLVQGLPENTLSLATLYGVADLLPPSP